MLRLFKKMFSVNVKAKYFLLETKFRGMKTEGRRPGDEARGAATVSQGLEVMLQGSWRPCTSSIVQMQSFISNLNLDPRNIA